MSSHNNIPSDVFSSSSNQTISIHELLSCEKFLSLAGQHEQLCVGLCSVVDGGCDLSQIKPLLLLLLEQSEELLSMLKYKHFLELSQ